MLISTNVPDRYQFADVLKQLAPNGTGVEIGVQNAHFADIIINYWKPKTYYLVDCWQSQPQDQYQDVGNVDSESQRRCFLHAILQLQANDFPRARFLQLYSHEAARLFDDLSLDFVYIDANHSYPAVQQDIQLWFPKLKVNGLLAGHDYNDSRYGVKQAVDEAFPKESICLTHEEFQQSWFVWKDSPTTTLKL